MVKPFSDTDSDQWVISIDGSGYHALRLMKF